MDDHIDHHLERLLAEHKRRVLDDEARTKDAEPGKGLPQDVKERMVDDIQPPEPRCEPAERTTLRAFIGSPVLPPISELLPDEIESELQGLLEILSSNGITVHFGRHVSDAEMYRFITEELLCQKLDTAQMEGMTITFFYEEFHPDDQMDASLGAEDFLAALFNRSEPALVRSIGGYDSHTTPRNRNAGSRLRDRCRGIMAAFALFLRWEATIAAVEVTDDTARVVATVHWEGLRSGSLEPARGAGTCTLWLIRCEYAGWDVIDADLPDL